MSALGIQIPQVIVTFLIAAAFYFHTLLASVGDWDLSGDYILTVTASILTVIFAVVSAIALAKAVRDRADADTLGRLTFKSEKGQHSEQAKLET